MGVSDKLNMPCILGNDAESGFSKCNTVTTRSKTKLGREEKLEAIEEVDEIIYTPMTELKNEIELDTEVGLDVNILDVT